MIKVVIIDDEYTLQEVDRQLLTEYFPDVKVVGTAESVDEGVEVISRQKPDLVLLDIAIKGGTGFQILQKLRPYNFKVVFITAFESYAIKAIKYSALDYILKPVNEAEFQQAVQRAIDQINENLDSEIQNEVLLESLKKDMQNKKLVLKTSNSLHIVEVSDILFCRSDNSYTTFFINGDEKVVVSRSIKEYEDLLAGYNFFRPHQSYLVNLNFVKKLDKTDGGFIVMKNGDEIPVSKRQKKQLIKQLGNL